MLELDTIYQKTYKNEVYLENDKFYSWIHWKLPWIETTDWKMAVDAINPNKKYDWSVNNFIKDAVDTFVNFANWIWDRKLLWNDDNTINTIKEFNLEELYDELTKNMLVTWNSYLYFYTNSYWKFSTQVLSNQNCYVIDENDKILEAYIVEKQNISKFTSKIFVKYFSNDWKLYTYADSKIISVEDYLIIPIIKFWNWTPFISKDLKSLNSDINITYTRASEIEKYCSNPMMVVTWISEATMKKWVKIDAKNLLTLSDPNAKFERLASEWISSQIIDVLKRKETNFYKTAKLSWVKDWEVIVWDSSWVAMLLKLVDTISKTDEIRSYITQWFIKFFDLLVEIWYIKSYDFKLEKTIFESMQEKSNVENKISYEKSKLELIKQYLDIWYSKEEALKLTENL